jgi:hypothetical protein
MESRRLTAGTSLIMSHNDPMKAMGDRTIKPLLIAQEVVIKNEKARPIDMHKNFKNIISRLNHVKLPSRQKTKRAIFLENTQARDNIVKVEESKPFRQFIPRVDKNPSFFPSTILKHGGPSYVPTN